MGLTVLLLSYFMAGVPVEEGAQQMSLLELTEEMLVFIAQLFGVGIILGLIFLLTYFVLYLVRGCFREKKESARRENMATKVVQICSLYPGHAMLYSGWRLVQY